MNNVRAKLLASGLVKPSRITRPVTACREAIRNSDINRAKTKKAVAILEAALMRKTAHA